MDIGTVQRIIHAEPLVLPVPEVLLFGVEEHEPSREGTPDAVDPLEAAGT